MNCGGNMNQSASNNHKKSANPDLRPHAMARAKLMKNMPNDDRRRQQQKIKIIKYRNK